MLIEAIVYLGRDRPIELALSVVGLPPLDHTAITRCQVLAGATVLDSSVTPALFDLTNADRIIFKFRTAPLATGRYAAMIIVYDNAHPNGLPWGEIVLIVKQI